MKLIVTEMAQIKIECGGGVGIGTISQGTIPISGGFIGSCDLNPTYIDNITIDGAKIVSKLNFELFGAYAGYLPSVKATGSMQGTTINSTGDDKSFILMDQTANIINGVCNLAATPFTPAVFTGTASFVNAGQGSSFGE